MSPLAVRSTQNDVIETIANDVTDLNWNAISAVGEVVSAVAVVATLLYLAREIHQNSRSLAVSGLRDTTAQWNLWSEMLATSGDLAEIVAKGNRSYAGLSEVEALRYGAWVQAFFDNVESYRSLVTDHKIDKDLGVLEKIVIRRIALPGFADWWSENAVDYSGEFVAWIESLKLRKH